ncbi:MAG: TIGR04219 family outer membrane beta-barrel protein [Cocleimonas sp.]|nr:TIGR04219 family outer membrane beta-barrel protein [Cocleimonas sp.]
MKTITTLILTSLCLTMNTVNADTFLGGDAEVGVWFPDYNEKKIGISSDLKGKEQSLFGSVTVEHPIPLLPNLKAAFSTVDNEKYKYTKLDYSVYYEIFDNDAFSIDLGLGISDYENGEYHHQSFSGLLPHFYNQIEVRLPFTGMSLYTDIHYLDISDNQSIDAIAGLHYDINLGVADLGIKAGYRLQKMNLGDFDDLSFNLKTEGYFTALHLDF